MIKKVRHFFESRDFLEVMSPHLSEIPSSEPHLDPLKVYLEKGQVGYLNTSPEYALKKVLGLGAERIFEIAHSYRAEEPGPWHSREFLMLEWYVLNMDMMALMEQTKGLLQDLLEKDIEISYESVEGWMSKHKGVGLEYQELLNFLKKEGVALSKNPSYDELFYRIFLGTEKHLPQDGGVFLYDFPEELAAYATVKNSRAKRFEFYLNGVELANAFEEEKNPELLKQRVEKDQEQRLLEKGEPFPIDEDFIQALAKVDKPIAGIALGLDRLIALSQNHNSLLKSSPFGKIFRDE